MHGITGFLSAQAFYQVAKAMCFHFPKIMLFSQLSYTGVAGQQRDITEVLHHPSSFPNTRVTRKYTFQVFSGFPTSMTTVGILTLGPDPPQSCDIRLITT